MNYIQLKKVFVENHGLLSGNNIVPYLINQQLKLCWIQMQKMGGTYTIVQHHAGLNVVLYLKLSAKCQPFDFCYKTYTPHILLMNLLNKLILHIC